MENLCLNETPTISVGRIYLITNLINDKKYVGIATRTLRERFNEHTCHKKKKSQQYALQKAIHKYGKKNFKIELIEELHNVSENDIFLKESFYIKKHNTFIDDGCGYNLIKESTKDNSRLIISKSTRKKMSKNSSNVNNPFYGKHHSEETKKKIGGAVRDYRGNKNPFFGKTHTEENKQKSREYNKTFQPGENHPRFGKTFTEESRKKMSLSHKGRWVGEKNPFYGKRHTEETKRLLSISHTGKPVSEETRKKLSQSLKGRTSSKKGMPISDETKLKISKSSLGRISNNFDKTIRKFKNIDNNIEFLGVRKDFIKTNNLNRSSVDALIKGRLKSLKGWTLETDT